MRRPRPRRAGPDHVAGALAEARKLASQANAANAAATATAGQLGSVVSDEATASKTDGDARVLALTGNIGLSSYATDVQQQYRLQSSLSDQQGQAASLGTQAVVAANRAAASAAAVFNEVATMAGSASAYGSSNYWDADLGASSPAQAQAIVVRAESGGGATNDGASAYGPLALLAGAVVPGMYGRGPKLVPLVAGAKPGLINSEELPFKVPAGTTLSELSAGQRGDLVISLMKEMKGDGIARDMRYRTIAFAVANDAEGNPTLIVTSSTAPTQEIIKFLQERVPGAFDLVDTSATPSNPP